MGSSLTALSRPIGWVASTDIWMIRDEHWDKGRRFNEIRNIALIPWTPRYFAEGSPAYQQLVKVLKEPHNQELADRLRVRDIDFYLSVLHASDSWVIAFVENEPRYSANAELTLDGLPTFFPQQQRRLFIRTIGSIMFSKLANTEDQCYTATLVQSQFSCSSKIFKNRILPLVCTMLLAQHASVANAPFMWNVPAEDVRGKRVLEADVLPFCGAALSDASGDDFCAVLPAGAVAHTLQFLSSKLHPPVHQILELQCPFPQHNFIHLFVTFPATESQRARSQIWTAPLDLPRKLQRDLGKLCTAGTHLEDLVAAFTSMKTQDGLVKNHEALGEELKLLNSEIAATLRYLKCGAVSSHFQFGIQYGNVQFLYSRLYKRKQAVVQAPCAVSLLERQQFNNNWKILEEMMIALRTFVWWLDEAQVTRRAPSLFWLNGDLLAEYERIIADAKMVAAKTADLVAPLKEEYVRNPYDLMRHICVRGLRDTESCEEDGESAAAYASDASADGSAMSITDVLRRAGIPDSNAAEYATVLKSNGFASPCELQLAEVEDFTSFDMFIGHARQLYNFLHNPN